MIFYEWYWQDVRELPIINLKLKIIKYYCQPNTQLVKFLPLTNFLNIIYPTIFISYNIVV